ncbi:MAG: TolC family protein [Verrucomicrobiota bacterium]|nr:TolC family protein [Verrucomicrobiota bacterium]
MQNSGMRLLRALLLLSLGSAFCVQGASAKQLSLAGAIALAKEQNPEILIARKQVEAARGGRIEARSGYLPSVSSSGLLRKRAEQEQSRLRSDDYNAQIRVQQNLYSGGAVKARNAMARLLEEKRQLELEAVTDRVLMDLRVSYYEALLNHAKVDVREQSVRVMRDELKAQKERFVAGTVGEINVRRAQVSLANEEPELYQAQTNLQNSYLRLSEVCGLTSGKPASVALVEATDRLRYQPLHPDLNECLAYASLHRPEVRSREIDVEIEEKQLIIDQSEQKPHVEIFSGYEVYSERDPDLGPEFNHGYVVGLNASWHIFDGHATQGRMIATRARREAAQAALEAAQMSVQSDVRSAFFDLQQADRVLESETRNVENASETLDLARGNLSAGLGTQLDVLQATSDITRTRTTRLSAIYLHNAALARLARACARQPEELGFASKMTGADEAKRHAQVFDVARPPNELNAR